MSDTWGDLTPLRVLSEGLSDAKKARISTVNRVERGAIADAITGRDMIKQARDLEAWYEAALLDNYRQLVPDHVRDWAAAIPGMASGELFPRLLGLLGHPRIATPYKWEGREVVPDGESYERTLRQLWSYCGCGDSERNPRSDILGHSPTRDDVLAGGKRTVIRPLLYTFSTYLQMQHARNEAVADSRYWKVFAEAKAAAAGKVHQRQCQNKRVPMGAAGPLGSNGCGTVLHPEWGAPGSPWRPGHCQAHAHRLTAKQFLADLWEVSK